jgi:nitroimidazol reductase NimA-like FMN-containing flavoprotein (pyridoxamine 5'-phosphate oxidase superfamily)
MEPEQTAASEPRPSVQYIHQPECEALLRDHHIGRLGVVVHDHPEIFPMNYAMDGSRIAFRIDRGTKLASLRQARLATFEIDGVDEEERSGWSVMAVGPVQEIHDQPTIDRLEHIGLDTWIIGESVHWMRLSPHRLSGRRIVRL